MGRGLSKLQNWILKRAADKPDADLGFDLSMARILMEFHSLRTDSGKVEIANNFSGRAAEKARQYRPPIIRTVARLVNRGLVTCRSGMKRSGVKLTAKGRQYLRNQSVYRKNGSE